MEECKAGKDQDTKNVGEGSCFYGLVKECTKRGPVRMAIYGSGEEPMDTVIENGIIILDGEELTEQEARRFVSRHRADLERLFFEHAKAHSEEKEYCRDVLIASIADKAGESGTRARIVISDKGTARILLIGRSGDEPEFMIDGRKAGRKEAEHLIRDNYEQLEGRLHEAKRNLRGYTGDRKKAEGRMHFHSVTGKSGRFDINPSLRPEKKPGPELKEIRKITAKQFNQRRIRSHLKESASRRLNPRACCSAAGGGT